jgi:magnesium chelatase family protein
VLVRAYGASLDGIEGERVRVEVDAGRGLPSFQIVGQADRVVTESRDRIRAAFRACGLAFPRGRVTVNLAPPGIPKSGSALDLPIAVAIAATQIETPPALLEDSLLVGELGLAGTLHPVRGVLALLSAARGEVGSAEGGDGDRRPLANAIVPRGNLAEAAVFPGLSSWGAEGLEEVIRFLLRDGELEAGRADRARDCAGFGDALDLADVRGQEGARRALEVAAAGGHNLLFVGPPGSGKTLLARRLSGLLPDLTFDEALEATRIHSVAGTLGGRSLIVRPPFRAPHHSTSDAGLIGGGRPLRPGEITLAHRGVLFLDELPEFRRPVLEALRQPLEEAEIRLVRSHGAVRLPACFQLISAMNPCPCGYRGEVLRECICDEAQVRRYRAKLSGPLLDRIDLQVAVPALPWETLTSPGTSEESSQAVRRRIVEVRGRQARRLRGTPFARNAELPAREVRRHSPVDDAGMRLLERAVEVLGLSMRAYVRVLRVARTIADLNRVETLGAPEVAEAIGYRTLDRDPLRT